ncbi:hypothetical protein GALMADRAFT_142372 [Galerina marginata CBS 339.88]|uniref:Nephrocystin 3-like N-terminal domain-containing protein n=1 Tax=Galerina marginata (strain CBS 339.88) TaxID=685588 RepID=A0A067SQR6_GALM3|nr:hypothetical protein GALMADRAFT_142372 [Galerina marginata CBS 339.88]
MFPHAKNLVVTGGTFIVQNEFHSHTHVARTEGLSLLQQHIAPGAFHNSDERYDPPKCHPHTRQAVLKKIMDWVKDPQKLAQFMWLYGPAGSGKTAIAQTIAEMCFEAGLLAATFFFSRSVKGRNEKTFLVTTLVYQMILVIPEIREQVVAALEHNPMLFSLSLQSQIQKLVVQPLNSALTQTGEETDMQTLLSRPRFIIVDGLDECNDPEAQVYILEVLLFAVKRLSLPVFFLIASRPEQQIRDAFNEDELSSFTTTLVLDDTYLPNRDIRILLESKFEEIKRKHPSRAYFPVPWPTTQDMSKLVDKSSGQFIYATTVMKYVESRRHRPPDRLEIILGLSEPGDDTPFAELDALYNHILSSVTSVETVVNLFIVLLFMSLRKTSQEIEGFLFYRPGEIDIILSDLHSLIAVPPHGDKNNILRISHASLGDFLLDRSRSGNFFIDSGVAHAEIMRLIIKHLVQDKDEPDRYREWCSTFTEHYPKAQPTPELLDDLYNFDLAFFFDSLTISSSPTPDAVRPEFFWSKVGIDDRWPNMSRRHPDSSKDLEQQFLTAFDTWLHTQLGRYYPREPSTTLMLTAATLGAFQESSREIYDMIHGIVPWTDVDTLKWKDPVRFCDQYYKGSADAEYYYGAIARFLEDRSRSKEYYIDGTKYAAFARLLLDFFLKQDVQGQAKNSYRVQVAKLPLDLLVPVLEKSEKTSELAGFLRDHPLRCAESEHPLYVELNKLPFAS